MRIPTVTAVAMLVLTCAVAAQAQNTTAEDARIQFEQGIKLFEDGKHEQAAIAFERAYELKPSYKILYNIGQVQNELGHYAAALKAYTRYLAEGGSEIDAERIAQVETRIEHLRALVGAVTVESDIEGAMVYVDDERQGDMPLDGPVFVDLGKHTVVIKQGAEELHREVVKVAGGQKVVIRIAADEEEQAPVAGETPPPVAEPEEAPKRIWTWVALGVGGAALIGAGITGGLAVKKKQELDKSCEDKVCLQPDWKNVDSLNALATTTDVLISVAAVGIAAGIVLYIVEPRLGSDEEPVVVAAPTVTRNSAGLSLVGRF